MTKIVINLQYKALESFINDLPNTFGTQGTIIQDRRNVIKAITSQGVKMNVKRFRKPIFFNRIVYSFFRKPKAYKAYYNALEVIKRGFDTPSPIAYIQEKRGGLLSLSYFISLQLDEVREVRDYYFSKANVEDQQTLSAFARYTAQLHQKEVLHKDYSPGNILISESESGYTFSLVDINRMEFRPVDIHEGCKNFCRLFEYDEPLTLIAKEYALERNFDVDECIRLTLYYKHQFMGKKERKKRLKKLIGKG